VFQLAISWLHEKGGVVALNVAKCAVTCAAMLILLMARKRQWPIAVMILAWLPALLVLSGRIYVRPETLTLLYLSIFLAVIVKWDRFPLLAFLLPIVQVAWVNSQGLFVLGPVVLGFGLIDSALRLGIFRPERMRGWVDDDPRGERGHVFGWPGQSVRNQRGALSRGTGRDDEQPNFRAKCRRADFDTAIHPTCAGTRATCWSRAGRAERGSGLCPP